MVVAGMFAMGLLATGLLYAYWTLHLMPFMPLQEAIVAEFPGSAPRVDGGQRKSHQQTPTILRIVMKSENDPMADDPESVARMTALRERIAELVEQKVEFPGLDWIELHVYQLLQEKEIRERSYRLELRTDAEWIEVDQKGNPISSANSETNAPNVSKTANENTTANPEPATKAAVEESSSQSSEVTPVAEPNP
jgi:hypothetical protein